MATLSKRISEYTSIGLAEAAAMVEAGIPTSRLADLQDRLALTTNEMAALVSINNRTLARRRKQKRLPPDESERVFRIGRLFELAEAALGGRSNAVEWLKEPNLALGNVAPLAMASNEPGARLVEQLIGRIEHGIAI